MGQRFQFLAKAVAGTAISFGFFLAVGSGIRCEPGKHLLMMNDANSSSGEIKEEGQISGVLGASSSSASKGAGASRLRVIALLQQDHM